MNGQIIPEETEKSIEVKQENATFLVIGDKAYTSEIIEEYNRNAEAKTEDFNTNAENKTASYNSNAADRTTAFNNNYDNKISAFNSNANKQTEEFDTHVLMQTNTFNNNAASTIANYNSNAEQKTYEFNQNALSYQEGIEDNTNRIKRLENDIFDSGNKTGTLINITDSTLAELKGVNIEGVLKQETTTGKNLLKTPYTSGNSYTHNGITYTLNSDNSIILNGTAASSSWYELNTNGENSWYLDSAKNYSFSVLDKNGNYVTGVNPQYWSAKTGNHLGNNGKLSLTDYMEDGTNSWNFVIAIANGTSLNNVTIYPQIEEGVLPTSYEPYTGEQPTPRPDYPQPIEVIEDSFNLVSCSKNLYNYEDRNSTQLPSEITVDEEGWITATYDNSSGTTSKFLNYRTNNLKLKTSTNYSVVAEVKNVSGNGIVYFTSKAWTTPPTEGQFSDKFEKNFTDLSNGSVYCKIIATEEDFSNILYGLRTYVVFSAGQSGSITFRLSVLDDTSVTANNFVYEPYQSTTVQINFPENEFLGKINDIYKDSLKIEYNEDDGKYHLYLDKNVGKVVLDSNENWVRANNAFQTTNVYPSNVALRTSTNFAYSTHYQYAYYAGAISNNINNGEFGWSGAKLLTVGNTDITNVTEFKSWLSTNNVEIYYQLAEPYVVDLGVVDMPLSYYPITNVYTTCDLQPTIEVSYYRDFKGTVKAMQDDLTSASSKISTLESDVNTLKEQVAQLMTSTILEESEAVE